MRRRWLPLIVTAVGVTAGVSTAQQPPGYVTKALSGDIVDGAPLAGISLFVPPRLRNDEAYYVADLGAGGQALIAGDQVAVTTGMQIPNSPAGTEIAFLGQTAVSQNGDLTMSATLGGTALDATNNAGVVEYNGTTNMIVQKGDPAPQTSDTYEFFGGLRRQQGDGLLFTSTLQPSGRQGLFARRDGVTKLVQQTGVTAPDGFVAENIAGHTKGRLLEDETENAFLALFFVVNFHPNLQQERVELIRNRPDDSNDVLIATDDAVPGLPAGTTFQGGFVPQLNDFGQVGMFIDYDGASTGRSLSVLELNGVVQSGRSVAKTGDPAPGAPGFQFTSFQNFVINQSGDVAFQVQLDVVPPGGGSGDLGPQNGIAPIVGNWYEGDDGQLALAAHNGMQAPGLDLGVTIEQIGFPALNDLS